MVDLDSQVAKIFVCVTRNGANQCLMARKRSKNKDMHKKLEFLGVHLNEGDTPIQAIKREPQEEEASGLLARSLPVGIKPRFMREASCSHHYLFRLEKNREPTSSPQSDPEESLAFRCVTTTHHAAHKLDTQFTSRALAILDGSAAEMF